MGFSPILDLLGNSTVPPVTVISNFGRRHTPIDEPREQDFEWILIIFPRPSSSRSGNSNKSSGGVDTLVKLSTS
jgi:hypothetical protein